MNTKMSHRLVSVAMFALLALPANAAMAQSAQSAAAQGGPPPGAGSPIAGHPVTGKTAEERVERRIKELHAQLHITPAQQAQWSQFAEVMRQNARDMDQAVMQRVQQLETINAVQNMQSYQQLAEEHAQHVQKLCQAFENLYNGMPDQQKQLTDQVFRANVEKQAQGGQSHRGRNG